MTKEKLYTIGEIFRGKLLLNRNGKPYGDKSQVAKVVRKMKHCIIKTKHGQVSRQVFLWQIEKHNAKSSLPKTDRKQPAHAGVRRKPGLRKNAGQRHRAGAAARARK